MTLDLAFINELSPTQEHFLKKFLVEACLTQELQCLLKPHCLEYIGPPFKSSDARTGAELPLLRYFFANFVALFPFITMNSKSDQISFWRDTVQPFMERFNMKRVSSASQRKETTTKRHQVNRLLLRTLLLFYNSMLSSTKEIEYLASDHLKPSDQGKLDKISKNPAMVKMALDAFHAPAGLDDYLQMVYTNNYNINIVAVDVFQARVPRESSGWSFNPLRLIGTTRKPHSSYSCVFILQVTRRTSVEGKYTYKSHFVPRKYADFKRLEKALKAQFPGLMSTEIHAMPRKMKHDLGVRKDGFQEGTSAYFSDNSANISGDISANNSTLPSAFESAIPSATDSARPRMTTSEMTYSGVSISADPGLENARLRDFSHNYYADKLRLAFRGYVNTLLHKPEIANCDAFLKFLSDSEKNFAALSEDQFRDYEQRMELERMRLTTQEEFQNHIARQVFELTKNFEKFKGELLSDPHLLSMVFVEIGKSAKPEEMSPLVTSFIEWCKLEIAATLYQMFLTQDNSSQWLQKCRKFHRMFPYRMCYGILKYTNPVKIMSRMVDLLLLNVPTFGRKSNQAHNLLSMIFIMLLDEDLQDFSKERQKLLRTKPLDQPEIQVFLARIRSYVSAGDASLQEDIRQEHLEKETSFFLMVLSSDLVEPRLSEADHVTFQNVIRPSYESYQNLSKGHSLDDSAVYVTLKQFWQLEVHTRDKEIFKQLWKEPELTQLIKKVLTVFYQPLMTVMKKCNMHLVFLDFQHFLDDLLAELTVLDEGDMYFTSSVEMFNRFKKLLDKYEGTFYRFLHDLHNKDDGKLFLKLIAWIESFLVALRTKFSDPEKVQLNFAAMKPTEKVDEAQFLKDLNSRIELTLKKRLLLKSCMTNAASTGNTDLGKGDDSNKNGRILSLHQQAIDQQWEKLNNGMFEMQPQELGLSGDDVEEFNLMHEGEKAADAFRNGHGNATVLRQITELDKLLNELTDTEIHKLIGPMQAQLRDLIGGI